MTLILCALALMLGGRAANDRGGWLWRLLIEGPAAWLSSLSVHQTLVLVLLLIIAPAMAQLAMADMALVLAIDMAGWIEISAAVLVVVRLPSGWRAVRGGLARALRRGASLPGQVRRAAGRAWRRRPPRRPGGGTDTDDGPFRGHAHVPNPGWALAA